MSQNTVILLEPWLTIPAHPEPPPPGQIKGRNKGTAGFCQAHDRLEMLQPTLWLIQPVSCCAVKQGSAFRGDWLSQLLSSPVDRFCHFCPIRDPNCYAGYELIAIMNFKSHMVEFSHRALPLSGGNGLPD